MGVWMGKGMGEGMEVRVRKGMSVGGAKDGVWKGLCDGEGSGGDGCLEEDRVEKGMRTGIWKGTGMENLMRMGMEKQTDIWEVMRMEKGMRMEMHKENGDSEVNVEGGGRGQGHRVGAHPPLPPPQVRPGQFHRRLWRSTRRISQVSAGETEYNPAEGKS